MDLSTASRITEIAIATRMTCSNPSLTGLRASPPVCVSFSPPDAAPGNLPAGGTVSIDAGSSTEALAGQLAAFIRQGGHLPAALVVAGLGTFRIHAEREGRLAGCIALVTGAAQGFGRGIVEELIAVGACVTVADINDPAGNALTAELNRKAGRPVALYGHVDVTDAKAYASAIAATIAQFGGLDMFVANAGILKAGGLDELDERSFDLVTSVNYKAYFLGVQAVARVMKLQHRFNPSHFMDIVQINSKSGLEGSNRNFAYAGSKFGTIGLTQSFALELVGLNIKVNSICPGNYLDGPLWSDPDKGLFVQYLKAGKIPGARTVDDVRKAYMAKVPMGRGCMPKDVARAIFYLREQEYETGQALPVTGGQVMLR